MDRASELGIIRRAYAKQVLAAAEAVDQTLEGAFATVHREDFLGPGPWPIVRYPLRYVTAPSADPVYLYCNAMVGIDPQRFLNNGEPSLHAMLMTHAQPHPGDHVVHIGTGTGYYTAILAMLTGFSGRVTGIEFDPQLAARAAQNLAPWPQATVCVGNGKTYPFDPADVIYVNAGVPAFLAPWLDRLKPGGRMVVPLSGWSPALQAGGGPGKRGAVFRVERCADGFLAKCLSPIWIYPCEGDWDEAAAGALLGALERGGEDRVTRLYRRTDVPEDATWLRGTTWSLAYR